MTNSEYNGSIRDSLIVDSDKFEKYDHISTKQLFSHVGFKKVCEAESKILIYQQLAATNP